MNAITNAISKNKNNHFWHDMLCMDVNLCYSDESPNQTHV